jgi:hypothetical protein
LPKGGARPGAGRKKGQRDKRTQEMLAKASAAGMLPHEFLCSVSQGQVIDGHTPTFAERMAAATQAAPYYAPRLQAIDQKHSGSIVHDLTDEQLDEQIRQLLAQLYPRYAV